MLKKINLVYVGKTPTRVRTETNAEKILVSYGDINSFDRKIADDLLRYKSSYFIEQVNDNAEVVAEFSPPKDNDNGNEGDLGDNGSIPPEVIAPKKADKKTKK